MPRKKQVADDQKATLTNKIREVYVKNPQSAFNYKQVSKRLGIEDRQGKDLVRQLIGELFRMQDLIESNRGKYRINPEGKAYPRSVKTHVTGVMDLKSTGKGYVIPDDKTEDVFIGATNTRHALHGDRVNVALFPIRKGHKREGEIVEILQRSKTRYVGVLEKTRHAAFLIPDSQNMPVEIFIPEENLRGARHGQKVVVSLVEWPDHARQPFGIVEHILGKPGENQVEMQSILAEFDFPLAFSAAAEKEASLISDEIPEREIRKRLDMREVFTITIDPADARDFDDALSLQQLTNGNWEVGIHIADVSHYVKPGGAIDQDAYQRGTSVYLVDRVIPMLPERLSNEVCSLQPDKDRLCYSALFELDQEGKVLAERYEKSIIHSDKRFTYEEAQTIIETGEGPFASQLAILHTLAKALRAERMRKGSINFETQEVRFVLDESGKPTSIYLREMKDSNKLIEEFMLLANRKVAEKIGKKKGNETPKPFVYRVHDLPNQEKLQTFVDLLRKLGYKLALNSNKAMAQSLNHLFREIKGSGAENMIETIAIRTMAKAFYSTRNIGHYGLAFPFYTHFTSPIRRYPDLMVHRLFEHYLAKGSPIAAKEMEEACLHTSAMERRAIEAERSSVKYKQTEYMLDKVGQTFDGVISGVSKWGIFVEINGTKCEGMIRMGDLGRDYYYLDEENFQVIGQREGKEFKLGNPIRIKVKRIDLAKKQMDFGLVE